MACDTLRGHYRLRPPGCQWGEPGQVQEQASGAQGYRRWRVRVISFARGRTFRRVPGGTYHPGTGPTPVGRGGLKPTAMLGEPWVKGPQTPPAPEVGRRSYRPSRGSAAPLRGLALVWATNPRLPEHRRGLYSAASFGGSTDRRRLRRRLHAPAGGARVDFPGRAPV